MYRTRGENELKRHVGVTTCMEKGWKKAMKGKKRIPLLQGLQPGGIQKKNTIRPSNPARVRSSWPWFSTYFACEVLTWKTWSASPSAAGG